MDSKKEFELQITVDFKDDLHASYFSEKTFREMMRIFRLWGITRVYWTSYPYSSGWWEWKQYPLLARNAKRTYEEVGDYTAAALRYAHEQGIELYVQFRPFDLGGSGIMPHDFRELPEGKDLPEGIPALGGAWHRGTDFIFKHLEFLIARNMKEWEANAREKTVHSVKLVKCDDAPTNIESDMIDLFVSTDNHHYQKYNRPFGFSQSIETRQDKSLRVIVLDGLDIPEPYLALSYTGRGPGSFYNFYENLIELYDSEGTKIPFTYGIDSRHTQLAWSWSESLQKKFFPQRGFMFDVSGDFVNHPGYSFVESIGILDKPDQFIGLAKGKNPYIPALSPAYPEVRNYWLSLIQEYIDMGVDGIDFRFVCHQDTMEWNAYGFNKPIVDEYFKRHGVNILEEEFDRAEWRKLRGEYYTLFYRQAKELLKKHGKKIQVDVTNENHPDPAMPSIMNIHADWREWLSFVDGVTLKNTYMDKDIYHEVKKTARRHGLPTYLNFNIRFLRGKNATRIIDMFVEYSRKHGDKGIVLYEAYTIMEAREDGSFNIIAPEIPEIVVPFFKREM